MVMPTTTLIIPGNMDTSPALLGAAMCFDWKVAVLPASGLVVSTSGLLPRLGFCNDWLWDRTRS